MEVLCTGQEERLSTKSFGGELDMKFTNKPFTNHNWVCRDKDTTGARSLSRPIVLSFHVYTALNPLLYA